MTVFEKKNPEANPRTVIGMVEPGHYMLIVVDGGGSSEMIFGGETVSRPSDDRDVSDIIYLTDILT